jgi:tetratricopeptide (TPR) repeat protein
MSSRKLAPYTIVPPSLYVTRDADRQIESIITDMGRPGYVLVARQMGKTNLLLNAKRCLEGEDDIFVYIDLSNRFSSEKECFRNIIDTILDVYSDKLDDVGSEIRKARDELKLVPHKEHSRELRKILSRIKGKLIVILDEIDSLTAADYSDKIFAQVRSVYFERVNYPEYERLSYIISGVAEPNDIIKDKSISPFNIGQKILLGDFLWDEYCDFLRKSCIDLPDDVRERIFYWLNGSPRLTWEVCSEIEKAISDDVTLSIELVDEVVKGLYLSKFDRPPIDHIRSLVEGDAELRTAVVSIHYGKGDSVPESVKSKLYLSGILGSNYEYGDVRIKNRVVEEGLSLDWIAYIEKSEKPSLLKADELFSKGDYNGASKVYESIASSIEFSESEILHVNYRLGACFYNLGEHNKVLSIYSNHRYSKDDFRSIYIEQTYFIAICHMQLGQYSEARDKFEELVQYDSEYKYPSLVIIAQIKYLPGEECDLDGSRSILESVISDHELGVDVPDEAIAAAYFSLARFYIDSNPSKAVDLFFSSFNAAPGPSKIAPLIEIIDLDPERFDEAWGELRATIVSGCVDLESQVNALSLGFTPRRVLDLVGAALRGGRAALLDSFFGDILENCFRNKEKYSEFVFVSGAAAVSSRRFDEAKYLLSHVASLDRSVSDPESAFQANKFLFYIDQDNESARDYYFKGFQNYIEVPDVIDIALFERRIVGFCNEGDLERASRYADMILGYGEPEDPAERSHLLSIFFLKMHCLEGSDEKLRLANVVSETVSFIRKNGSNPHRIAAGDLTFMQRESAKVIVQSSPVSSVARLGPKYGRNEKVKVRYPDGRTEMKKYKLVAESLRSGLCQIIDS